MNRFTALIIVALSVMPLISQAQSPAQHASIKQLKSSVESLLLALDSAVKQNPTLSQDLTHSLQNQAQQLIEQSQQIAQSDPNQPRQLLNRALIKIKIAINALKGTPLQTMPNVTLVDQQPEASAFVIEKRQAQIVKTQSSIDSLLQALIRIAEEKQQQALADDVRLQLDDWKQQSDQQAQQGQLIRAQQLLDRSLVELKTAIGSLRESETLVRSLNFATKQQEYAYELDRFATYQMLLQQLVLPKPALTQQQKQRINQWSGNAYQQKLEAEEQASQGLYSQAVSSLERAGRTLLKAIRSGGVYLPG